MWYGVFFIVGGRIIDCWNVFLCFFLWRIFVFFMVKRDELDMCKVFLCIVNLMFVCLVLGILIIINSWFVYLYILIKG